MSSARRRGNANHDRWLISFADFITLLFSLFVVLYAFARADQKKQAAVTASIDSAFKSLGIFGQAAPQPGPATNAPGVQPPAIPANVVLREQVVSAAQVRDDLEKIRRDLEQRLSRQLALNTVSVQMGPDGLVISLREAGFFESGSAAPRAGTVPTLRSIADSLNRAPYDIRIEGHTDNIPIHNREFDSNWELSSARATRIARLLLDLKAIPPNRLSAAGYAEFHPAATNSTAEGRAENRRVDLVVRPRSRLDFGPAARPGPPESRSGWRKIGDE